MPNGGQSSALEWRNYATSTACGSSAAKPHDGLRERRVAIAPIRALRADARAADIPADERRDGAMRAENRAASRHGAAAATAPSDEVKVSA